MIGLIDKEKFDKEAQLLEEYLKSRNLNHIEETLLLRAMLDFACDNRVIEVLQNLYNIKRKK